MADIDPAREYIKIVNKIDKLNARRKELRKHIIEEVKSGVDFGDRGLSVFPKYSYDWNKVAVIYKVKTGNEPPVVTIPARTEIDVGMLAAWVKQNEIEEGRSEPSYTVKRKKKK